MQRIENWVGKGLTKVENESEEYESIKNGFLKGMGFMGHATTIMAIHKNDVSSSLARQARWDSFKIFSKAVAIKSGGDANVRYAWYGASLDDLLEIVSEGFNGCKSHDDDDESHGVGIPLFSVDFSIDRCVRMNQFNFPFQCYVYEKINRSKNLFTSFTVLCVQLQMSMV